MSRPLREELDRIAERAPVADVPADTWERARRSVRRDALAVVAAVAAVVALVAGALAWLPDRAEVAPAEGDAGALPAYLPVPGGRQAVRSTDDLAVGAQAAAMVPDIPQGNRQVVVVDARTGEYRGLDLPRFGAAAGRDLSGTVHPVALSPDGTTLAYPTVSGLPVGATLRTGLGIVDLTTGEVRQVALEDAGRPVLVRTVSFSPGGGWLLWTGQPVLPRGSGRSFGDAAVSGRVAPGSTRSVPLPGRDRGTGLSAGIDDQGTVARVDASTRLLPVDDDSAPRALPGVEGVVLSGTVDDTAVSHLVNTYQPGDDREAAYSWVTASRADPDAAPRRLGLPDALLGATWRVLEWVDPDHVVVAVDVTEDGSTLETQVGVLTLAAGGATFEAVLTSDSDAHALTVATDLLADGAEAVERPLPAFAEERRSRTWWWVGGGLALVGALALARAVVRRRAQRRSAR
ncbi:hypothetical protein [Nocardioides salarius]|uniref:hypothetical protein n=1 Tax=Nocardioides salarius TaxID=374513 RepID=UPI0030F6A1F8